MASDVEARQLAIVKNATIYRVGNGTSVKVASGDLTVVQLPKVLAQAAATASTCSAATAAATTPKLQSSSSSTTPPATAVDAGTGAGGGAGGGAGAASGSASDESGAQTAAVAEGEEGQKNGAEHLVFLMLGTFSYPLVSQPALQADATRFVLPSDGFSWAVAAGMNGVHQQQGTDTLTLTLAFVQPKCGHTRKQRQQRQLHHCNGR